MFPSSQVFLFQKPYSFERFSKAIERARSLSANEAVSEKQSITVRADSSFVNVFLSDICFIEAKDDYVMINSIGNKSILVRMSLKKIAEQLPSKKFVRVHRSYIVSIEKIKRYTNRYVQMDKVNIPVSKAFESYFLDVVKGDG